MIPEGWQSTEIGKLADFKSGGTPSKAKPEFWGGSNPWISGKDLKQHYISSSIDMLSEEGFAVVSKAPKGASLILVRGMTLLKDFPVGFVEKTVSFNQDIKALIPKKGIDGLFLSFLLVGKKEEIRQLVSTAGHGTGRLDTESIKSFPVDIPTLPEQKKIAQILSTWDKAITTTEQLLANSQQQKKALMQQLLTGKKRLKGFGGEWKEKKFGEIFKERVELGREGLPLLSITAEDGVVYQDETGRKDTSNEDKSKYRRICVNDIGYNTMRMWQGRSSRSDKEGIVSPAYTIVIPNKDIYPKFAAYLFKHPSLIHVFYRHSQGLVSDTWNLKFDYFRKISWAFPEFEEQQKITAVLSAADREIDVLQQKLEGLKQEKKALMQQLLTGKRRVKV
ncbi:restriction endonuclease subunit S [Thiothrix fructosivorans]|uniref:Restriction endonuclease subunit S n=1 Tax=Thiothrix fructosivorans TaxID=111770 RepID=A0A8B0SRZ1_9GAMM|nr:restriction endonuclease subunit S [Thiothrix fructosivorans]MBO0612884.1 restriction endonuclease subunit S [Thiothrix fructosivorans]QTX11662.1 restriction endonuclease subunit S [Thiothrix fructosivorans]